MWNFLNVVRELTLIMSFISLHQVSLACPQTIESSSEPRPACRVHQLPQQEQHQLSAVHPQVAWVPPRAWRQQAGQVCSCLVSVASLGRVEGPQQQPQEEAWPKLAW